MDGSFWDKVKDVASGSTGTTQSTGGSGVLPFLPIIGGAVQAIPSIISLFQSDKPQSTFDPTAYQRDLQQQIALQTQAAIQQQQTQAVQQQAQASVEVERIRSESNKRLLMYGAGIAVAAVGLIFLVNSLRKGK